MGNIKIAKSFTPEQIEWLRETHERYKFTMMGVIDALRQCAEYADTLEGIMVEYKNGNAGALHTVKNIKETFNLTLPEAKALFDAYR